MTISLKFSTQRKEGLKCSVRWNVWFKTVQENWDRSRSYSDSATMLIQSEDRRKTTLFCQ